MHEFFAVVPGWWPNHRMFEHGDDSSGVLASFSGIKLPLSEEARASLAAVRAAQEAARLRARRETVKTRLWFAAIVGAISVTVIVLGPRSRRGSDAASRRPTAVASATASATAASGTAPGTGTTATVAARPPETPRVPATVASAASNAPAPAPAGAPAPGQTGASPAVAAPSAGDTAASEQLVSACTDAFRQRRWRLSIEACTAAFTARPKDARLALDVAKSYYAHARGVEAGQWASRAIALDPTLAEAFVLVARADGKAGQTAGAVDAYRRYLALAPRGWHAPEARAAVHARRRDEHAARLPPPPARPSHAAATPIEPAAHAAAAQEEAAAPAPVLDRTGG
jgi:hypothetical protein